MSKTIYCYACGYYPKKDYNLAYGLFEDDAIMDDILNGTYGAKLQRIAQHCKANEEKYLKAQARRLKRSKSNNTSIKDNSNESFKYRDILRVLELGEQDYICPRCHHFERKTRIIVIFFNFYKIKHPKGSKKKRFALHDFMYQLPYDCPNCSTHEKPIPMQAEWSLSFNGQVHWNPTHHLLIP